MNARIANTQMQKIDLMTPVNADKIDVLDSQWERCSKDSMTNPQGTAMISLMTSMQLAAMNGTYRFSESGGYTCYTANKGMSTIDYALINYAAAHMVQNFAIGDKLPNSDHIPIHVWIQIQPKKPEEKMQNRTWTYKMQINKRKTYATSLDSKLAQECMPNQMEAAWQILKGALRDTADEIMGKSKRVNRDMKGLPHNAWFDEECKLAKRALQETPQTTQEWTTLAKNYTALKRRKRREYEIHRETQAIINFKQNPKKEWMRMKGKHQDIMGDISLEKMLAYVEHLYVHEDAKGMPEICNSNNQNGEYFEAQAITKSIQKLANGKAPDTLQLKSEMLKWTGPLARQWIHELLNKAIMQGLPPVKWQQNWIKALFKKGDINQPTNYRTIMVGSCMSKLLGSILEQAISSWAKTNDKRAKGQASFKPKHSTIDHLISLRVLMEESRLKGKNLHCCFVDFTKAFDTIPRAGLWQRMEHIGVPIHLRMAVARQYQQVRCRLKTHAGLSREFGSNMGVKQGCPLSPTLFGLCIDQLEEYMFFIRTEEQEGPAIGMLVLVLLIYADDLALFAHTIEALQKLVDAIHAFCENTGLSVNVNKTKFIIVSTLKKNNQPILMYQGSKLSK
ncbi:hypothetical protein L7F22_066965 [Adiantum nelumboides]|nr:hypothetical protein [Adiantum nelumboides]